MITDAPIAVPTFGEDVIYAERMIPKGQEARSTDSKKPLELKEGQKELVKFYKLDKYKKEKYDENGNTKDGNKWLKKILTEIIDYKCQNDSDAILNPKCTRFREYLGYLSLQLVRYPNFLKKKNAPKENAEDDATNSNMIGVKVLIKIPIAQFRKGSELEGLFSELDAFMNTPAILAFLNGIDTSTSEGQSQLALLKIEEEMQRMLNTLIAEFERL